MVKTLTFAATHFSVAFGVAYLLTGNIGVSSLLALVEPAVNTVAYYFHEKAWLRFGAAPAAPGRRHGWHAHG
ncbi:DUF2061 domain-containing protein [Chitinimonas koreensis]|uniref:DUF2061 domain-containing protein n=1 Tax=Chitinimonas koreensis TaxID=356302 RepID=UPI00040E0714|nr:DUF2061 domain-containing protein [Chitinimonas koreensis]QNM95017.1 DUF2061 domain-containing protein [Chitinimonas koreensis]